MSSRASESNNPDLHFSQFDLKEREWCVLMMILELTLFRGRVTTLIPQQQYIADVTGLPKSHVSTVLKRLEAARAVVVDSQGRYTIQPASCWDGRLIQTRIEEADARTAAARLAWLHELDAGEAATRGGRVTAREELVREPEGLERALAEQSLLRAAEQEGPATTQRAWGVSSASEPVTRERENSTGAEGGASGNGTEPENRVTKSVTADGPRELPNRELSYQIGNSGAALAVTKSVTPAAPVQRLNVQRLSAPNEGRLNVERLNGDPLARENALLARVAAVVGHEDLKAWGGDWRKNWLRVFPHETVVRAIEDHESRLREGWRPANPGAALKDTIRRFAPRRA